MGGYGGGAQPIITTPLYKIAQTGGCSYDTPPTRATSVPRGYVAVIEGKGRGLSASGRVGPLS